jgi:hypothetical protein
MNEDPTQGLIDRAMKLDVKLPEEGVVNLDTLYIALKSALSEK